MIYSPSALLRFGRWLRLKRLGAGLSVKVLAQTLAVSRERLRLLEEGVTGPLDEEVHSISLLLRCHVNIIWDLLHDYPKPA